MLALLAMQVGNIFTASNVEAKVAAVEIQGPSYLTLQSGYAGATYYVTGAASGATYVWGLEPSGAPGTFYYWPSGGVCDVSIYSSSSSGTIRLTCTVTAGGTVYIL